MYLSHTVIIRPVNIDASIQLDLKHKKVVVCVIWRPFASLNFKIVNWLKNFAQKGRLLFLIFPKQSFKYLRPHKTLTSISMREWT